MQQLKDAVESMDKTRETAKADDPLRELREWRLAATLRFTGKSVSLAKMAKKGRGK